MAIHIVISYGNGNYLDQRNLTLRQRHTWEFANQAHLPKILCSQALLPENQEDVNLSKISKGPFKNDVIRGEGGGGHPKLATKSDND